MTEQDRIEAEVKTIYGSYRDFRNKVAENIKKNHGTVGFNDIERIKKEIARVQGSVPSDVTYEDILVDHLTKGENRHEGGEFLRLKKKLITAFGLLDDAEDKKTTFEGFHIQLEQAMSEVLRGKMNPEKFDTFHHNLKDAMEELIYPEQEVIGRKTHREKLPELKPFPERKPEKRP